MDDPDIEKTLLDVMNKHLQKVDRAFLDNNDVMILSHDLVTPAKPKPL
jgi:hypothetical protein